MVLIRNPSTNGLVDQTQTKRPNKFLKKQNLRENWVKISNQQTSTTISTSKSHLLITNTALQLQAQRKSQIQEALMRSVNHRSEISTENPVLARCMNRDLRRRKTKSKNQESKVFSLEQTPTNKSHRSHLNQSNQY